VFIIPMEVLCYCKLQKQLKTENKFLKLSAFLA
jgi:hypothetical protein